MWSTYTDTKAKDGCTALQSAKLCCRPKTELIYLARPPFNAENMRQECIKSRREAVNTYKDPKHRELMGGTRFMFMLVTRIRADVVILEHGTWHINKILG